MPDPNVLNEARKLIDRLWRERVFLATVVDESGESIKVQRDGAATDDGVFYAAAGGLAGPPGPIVDVGDRVLVIDATGAGGYVVVCKVVT